MVSIGGVSYEREKGLAILIGVSCRFLFSNQFLEAKELAFPWDLGTSSSIKHTGYDGYVGPYCADVGINPGDFPMDFPALQNWNIFPRGFLPCLVDEPPIFAMIFLGEILLCVGSHMFVDETPSNGSTIR